MVRSFMMTIHVCKKPFIFKATENHHDLAMMKVHKSGKADN